MSVTGRAAETLLIKAIASRRGKLCVLTHKKNEINALLETGESKENVRKHAEVFNKYVEEFIELQNTVHNLLSSEEEKEADNTDWFEPKLVHFRDFINGINKWMDESEITEDVEDEEKKNDDDEEKSVEDEEHKDKAVGPEDSVSQTKKAPSKASSSSSSSRALSACLKAKAERAALMAKVQALEMKHALDMQQAQITAKGERLAIEAELAAAEAKVNVYIESESLAAGQAPQPSIITQINHKPSSSRQLKSESISPIHQLKMSGASTEYMIPVTAQKPPKHQNSGKSNISHQAPLCKAKTWIMTKEMETQIKVKRIVSLMRKQNEITELLLKVHCVVFKVIYNLKSTSSFINKSPLV